MKITALDRFSDYVHDIGPCTLLELTAFQSWNIKAED